MSYLTNVKKAMRLQRLPTSLTLWKAVVGIAVTSNSYSIDDEIRVLLLIKVGRIDLLIEWADAISQQVYGTPMLHYRMHQIAALIRKYPFPEKISGLIPGRPLLKSLMRLNIAAKGTTNDSVLFVVRVEIRMPRQHGMHVNG
jgi:hypothetical protein